MLFYQIKNVHHGIHKIDEIRIEECFLLFFKTIYHLIKNLNIHFGLIFIYSCLLSGENKSLIL